MLLKVDNQTENLEFSDVELICEVVEKDTTDDKLYLISECEVEYKYTVSK